MTTHAAPVAARLLERDHELEQLQAAIAAAAAGAGAVVALEGEAGIGKTALLAHASSVARDAGMRVLVARGGELEREFAYGIVRQLFEAPLAAAKPAERRDWLAARLGSRHTSSLQRRQRCSQAPIAAPSCMACTG